MAGGDDRKGLTIPYVPTDPDVVKKMLGIAAGAEDRDGWRNHLPLDDHAGAKTERKSINPIADSASVNRRFANPRRSM